MLAVTLVAMLVGGPDHGRRQPGPGRRRLHQAEVAGIVGAETITACGQEAVETCSHAAEFSGARAETIVSDCKTRGIKF